MVKKGKADSSPSSSAESQGRTVLPAQLPPEIRETLRQALHPTALKKGFDWILERLSNTEDALELTENFIERYEEQIMHLKGNELEMYRPVFRAALLNECLKILQSSRMRFAQQGFNPVFIRTWLQKRLLATMMGITVTDVDLKIRLSTRKPPEYLTEQIEGLTSHTYLSRFH